jgi:hypothetical protein
VLAGRPEVKLPSDLHEDEAQAVLEIIDIEEQACEGDTKEMAAAIWRRVNAMQPAHGGTEAAPDA